MARPRHEHPTPAELKVLQVLWDGGSMTVRQVMEQMEAREHRPDRAYTSVMSLMNVMADKSLLKRTPHGRAFLYSPKVSQQQTQSGMLGDLLSRAYSGSASLLVMQLLDQSSPSTDELKEIRKAIEAYQREKESD